MSGIGGRENVSAAINMTPMIDVLLVLLIIFMVLTPQHPLGLKTLLPQEPTPPVRELPEWQTAVVLEVTTGAEPSLRINQQPLEWAQLEERLAEIYKTRARKLIFVKADGEILFQHVARAIDAAGRAGVTETALLTRVRA